MSATVPDRPAGDPVSPTVQRLTALSGVFFVVFLILTILFLGDEPPDYDDPVKGWTAWAEDNDTNMRVAALLFMLATYNFVLFVGYLRSVVGEAELALRGFIRGGYVILAGGIVGIVGLALAVLGITVSAQLTDAPPEMLRVLNFVMGAPFALAFAGLGACLITTGLLNLGLRALPAWLGWVALVSGVSFVLTLGTILSDPGDGNFFDIFFALGFLTLVVFVAGSSVVFFRRASAT